MLFLIPIFIPDVPAQSSTQSFHAGEEKRPCSGEKQLSLMNWQSMLDYIVICNLVSYNMCQTLLNNFHRCSCSPR